MGGGGGGGRPAVVDPGAADEPATDDDGAGQNSPTSRRRSVHQRSLPSWLPQAWVRSITHRRPTWMGAGTPWVAIWATIPRSASTCRQVW
jgi:hypothetical protein